LAKHYNGKFVLRFEDTNPELAKEEFYKIHLDNYEWLGIKPDKIDHASDHMEEMYQYAEKIIRENHAYICLCKQEQIKEMRKVGIECEHRYYQPDKNLELWKEMLTAKAGKMILRLKGHMQSQNSTLRDPAIFRVIDEPHPRHKKKYRVWPMYDFENAIMDGIEGVTHRLRSKEFELRNELQRLIQTVAGFPETKIYEFARFNMEGVESSGRIIREKVQKKQLIGWDDPSLTTLVALKECSRYFFVENPKEIKVENAPEQNVELKLHPESKERGMRKFKAKDRFYVADKDLKEFKEGKLVRLMDCLNFKKNKTKFVFDSIEYEKYKSHGDKIIHWLPAQKDLVKVEVLMPDKKVAKGLAEPMVKNLKIGDIVQFSRFGFCKLDSKEKDKLKFWYTHD